jgi:hypothetical protein
VTEVTTSSSYLSNLSGKPTGKSRWSAFFHLIFRHSACQHPLIASGVARMALDKSNAEVISNAEGAMQQVCVCPDEESATVMQLYLSALCLEGSGLHVCTSTTPTSASPGGVTMTGLAGPAQCCKRQRQFLRTDGRDGHAAQILSMTMSNSLHVVMEGCRTLSALAASPDIARGMIKSKVMQSLYHLLGSADFAAREAGLHVVADLAFTSEDVSAQMCTPFLLATLMQVKTRTKSFG